ncbi:MAG: cobaltochelatase subunit CobN [Verrucomicrobia subdivision 3 bacterium]|nr:cobaltochelatase subunit CobN [Limisphaerales bacterium]
MTSPKANRVLRPDGRFINVPRHRGQLFVCATGCCCGHVARGFAPVRTDIFHEEWERRKLRNKIHLTQGGCLGPCPLANVVTLFFDGRFIGFQGIDDPKLILAIYDYLDAMMERSPDDSANIPLPLLLQDRAFDYFTWSLLEAQHTAPAHESRGIESAPTPDNPTILFLTHADTDLLAISKIIPKLPADFPSIHAFSLNPLKNEVQVSAFLDEQLPGVQVVVARLHGGRVGFRQGFEALISACNAQGKDLVCVPGTADPDPELTAVSNAPLPVIHDVYNYLTLGGLTNIGNLFRYLADNLLVGGFGYDLPTEQPQHGIYYADSLLSQDEWLARHYNPARPTAAVLFYRAHWLSGNTAFVDALCEALTTHGFNALPIFSYSLREQRDGRPVAFDYCDAPDGRCLSDIVICTMLSAFAATGEDARRPSEDVPLPDLGVPVLQAITSSMERDQWELSARGLSPLDTALHVAMPEFDGRIITVPITFKGVKGRADDGEPACQCGDSRSVIKEAPSAIPQYIPLPDRVRRVAELAHRIVHLQRKPNSEKRIAVILTNQPGRASRIGNAVGLDTPASLINLFQVMQAAGYRIEHLPPTGSASPSDALIHELIDRCAYDVEYLTDFQLAQAAGSVVDERYAEWFARFPERNRQQMDARWEAAPGRAFHHAGALKFAGLELGNVFVALQPPRGYGMDPQAIYHTPDLPPTHHYAAFYRWLREPRDAERGGWGADAILHMGKHGTLEWLPGKGIGLSETCYSDLFLSDLPLIYPFIINDPGEGMQAKRRAHAVIVDHLTPPMTTADAYGDLDELRQLVDEYYQLEALDPSKLPMLQSQIWDVIKRARLDEDLKLLTKQQHGNHSHDWDPTETEDGTPVSLAEMRGKDFAHLMEDLDGYLCELTSAQIRDGLYIIGEPLADEALVDLLVALTRLPNLDVPSLRASVAEALGLNLSELLDHPGARYTQSPAQPITPFFAANADALEFIDAACCHLVADLQGNNFTRSVQSPTRQGRFAVSNYQFPITPTIHRVLDFICNTLVPALRTSQHEEVTQILNALAGHAVPAGPSGAPTRGMAHVLPTGRNFYSVDPRSLPSQTAWRVGQALADELLKRYMQEEGAYPEMVGLSLWGTSAMRTHGDDLAQCFALLGVRPCWQSENRRLIGVEPIPLAELGRPRIDVVMRISGFFRDAFPHLIALMDQAVRLVSELDEPPDQNFVRKHVLADSARYESGGVTLDQAQRRATYRVFGSKPGSYGAGILPLIDERNWQGAADFAEAYINWGGYAYAERGDEYGVDMRSVFREVLAGVQVAVKNQDNREHDIFDSDDYLQYHGGMIAAIRALSGKSPHRFFGDNSDPERVKVRDLREETRRVFRSRVVNPKWIESITRHGYKGGLELAATVDYLFGYDATADVMEDWMYAQVAEHYALDESMQEFLRQSNPWALQAILSRLLETIQRGMWNADEEMQKRLRDAYLNIDGDLEDRLDRAWAKHTARATDH